MNRSFAQGFGDPVMDAQAMFRCTLNAMAHPGSVQPLPNGMPEPPEGLNQGQYAVALALLDYETPVWFDEATDNTSAIGTLRFHCGCPRASEPENAVVAMIGGALPKLDRFAFGTAEFPDRSATLLMRVENLRQGSGRGLTGPGIADTNHLAVDGLHPSFWTERNKACGRFPLGVDVIFTTDREIAALPRTTAVAG